MPSTKESGTVAVLKLYSVTVFLLKIKIANLNEKIQNKLNYENYYQKATACLLVDNTNIDLANMCIYR